MDRKGNFSLKAGRQYTEGTDRKEGSSEMGSHLQNYGGRVPSPRQKWQAVQGTLPQPSAGLHQARKVDSGGGEGTGQEPRRAG